MTNSTTTSTRPVVKSMKPELYVQHTFHMQRARKYTYNYSVSDDYILQNWRTSTITAIVRRSPKLLKRRKMLVTWLKEIDTKLEGVA